MENIIQFFILIPLLGVIAILFLPRKDERAIFTTTAIVFASEIITIFLFILFWSFNHQKMINKQHLTIFETGDVKIFIDYCFDLNSAVFGLVGAIIALMVSIFSRTYLHREEGFKRFFALLVLFFAGYSLVVFSGNFETLFVGWEIVGITSFLLIAFYRDRYLPVKNALKVISLYRLGDICLILAMWMSHHLWNENIIFIELNDPAIVDAHLKEHSWYGVFIAFMIVIAAAIKSAQIPFSTWLPRAFEGPTSSSAIFYGSLSINLGVFLLLRTYPYWESITIIKIILVVIGISTAIICSLISRVQSTVKTQIAYASVAQIGLIFIEVALGLHVLALVHFVGNAFLRTYQLLVSPSVLSYLSHNMLFNFDSKLNAQKRTAQSSMEKSLYILSIKEWNIDHLHYNYFWKPFKLIGNILNAMSNTLVAVLISISFVFGVISYFYQDQIHIDLIQMLPFLFSFIALALILHSFSSRRDALTTWNIIVSSQLFIALAIALLNEDFEHNHILLYLSGSAISATVGYICLKIIKDIDSDIKLDRFHGYIYEKPKVALVFLFACLGLVGLPFTPTFIGIDLLFSHIHKLEVLIISITALSFLFIELAVIRIYARVFLGQHKKLDHPVAYKSS